MFRPAFSTTTLSARATEPADNRLTIVGVVLGIIGVLLVAGVLYVTLRMRREGSLGSMHNSQYFPPYPRRRLDSNHPAVHITPFGLPDGETPRFKHTPGSDMRIATRRLDGGWQFSDPQPPFTPSGASNRVVPSPSSSKGKLPPDMRIATRGSDGAWQFSDPEAPFTPSGVSDIDVTPSPSSSTGLLPPRVSSRDGSSKGSYRHESNITLPPPAYGYDYSGHLSPRKR